MEGVKYNENSIDNISDFHYIGNCKSRYSDLGMINDPGTLIKLSMGE